MSVLLLLIACGAEEVAPPAPAPAPAAPPAAKAPPATSVGEPLDLATVTIEKWYRPYTADGKVSVVVFWELWCPHCKREVPKLTAIDAIDGVQVVGLTRQSKGVADADVEAFLASQNVAYAVGKTDAALAQRLKIRSIPTAVVVKDGKILWQGNPGGLTEAQLKGWM